MVLNLSADFEEASDLRTSETFSNTPQQQGRATINNLRFAVTEAVDPQSGRSKIPWQM